MDDLQDNIEDVEVIYLDSEEELEQEFMEEVPDNFGLEDEIDHEVTDLSKLTFTNHSKSVFCGDVSKDGQLATTGGEDDVAYLWSTIDGTVKLECTGHKDSITATAFSHDNQFLATGDMAGLIQVWNIKENKLVWCHEGDDMEWLIWHPLANILVSGSQSGDIYIWQIPQGNCKVLPSHGSPCTCGKILPDGKQLLAGYEDGQLKLWDIKTVNVNWNASSILKTSITSIEINKDGSLCSIAPNSNIIKVADGKILGSLLVDNQTEIETHLFSNEMNLLITGSLNGQICVWDLNKHAVRHHAKLECGVTVLKSGGNGRIFVGCTGGAVYVCDIKTGALVETLTGHRADILSMCVFCDNNLLLTTSDDHTAKIFAVQS